MPNTLAHIGINGIFTRSVIKESDFHWIYLGCIIPDVPWIIRKIALFSFPSINGYDLQLYVIVQASLFFSLILSLALASSSKNFLKTFGILAIGSLLHLLLDPIQIKWANGVHLFAPFSWELTNYGVAWPESFITYLITFFGLIYFIFNWNKLKTSIPEFDFSIKRLILGSIIFLIYFILPTLFISDVEMADNHFVTTLKNQNQRVDKYVETDRKKIYFNNKTNSYWTESFDKDLIELTGVRNLESSKLSIKGTFVTNDLIKVEEYHENWVLFRDGASYIGLILILFIWINSLKRYYHFHK